jgi:uncharacterized protein (TIGR02444 family)
MRLWAFAVALHGEPGVDQALIDLQDHHGQCVSYLLWAVWAARQDRPVDAADLQAAAGLARDWEAQVTAPLRAARRHLKRSWPMAAAPRERLRSRVKAAELAAERTLLQALEARTPKRGAAVGAALGASGGADLAARLNAAIQAWSTPAPVEALATLLPIFQRVAI